MLGNTSQVLVDYAYSDKPRRCPFALTMQPVHGGGVIVERCDRQEHHKGPHLFTLGGACDGHSPVLVVRVAWRTVAHEVLHDVVRETEWREGDLGQSPKPHGDGRDKRWEECEA
jgi:hypothetical protein